MQYAVYYGSSVPYQAEVFTSWAEACKFMKKNLDKGVTIHSVSYEETYDNDE